MVLHRGEVWRRHRLLYSASHWFIGNACQWRFSGHMWVVFDPWVEWTAGTVWQPSGLITTLVRKCCISSLFVAEALRRTPDVWFYQQPLGKHLRRGSTRQWLAMQQHVSANAKLVTFRLINQNLCCIQPIGAAILWLRQARTRIDRKQIDGRVDLQIDEMMES